MEKLINDEKLKSSFESVKAFNEKRKKLRQAFLVIGEILEAEYIIEIFDKVANPLDICDIQFEAFLQGVFLVSCQAGFIDCNKNDFLHLLEEVHIIRFDDDCPF